MQSSNLPPNTDQRRICLLVDDSRVVRRIAAAMFQEMGYHTMEAQSGVEALEVLRDIRPDLILLDWNMPEMDGITCLTNLRLMPMEQPKVILCTTENTLEKINIAMNAGADEYIMKPFDKEILHDKLVQIGLEEAA